jgi:hypothetical protein
MSEPDSTPRRRPPTIDLTAKEVETEATASTQNATGADASAAPASADGGRRRARARPYVIGILAGAAAVAAIVAGVWLAGLVPLRETEPSAPAAKAPVADEGSSRLAVEAQGKSLGDALAALTRRVDDVAAAAQSALADAKAASSAAEQAKSAGQSGVQRGDVEALANRIAALESAVQSLRAEAAQRAASANADDGAVRAVVAAEALRAAVERGARFQAELAAAKSLGAEGDATAALDPFAADGVPSAAALGRELSALVPALQQASEPETKSDSFLGRLESGAQKLVRITPLNAGAATTPAAGDDASSLIARINADAMRSNTSAALTDIARLPEAPRALAAAWVKKAQAREAAVAASERIAAAALGALTKPASQ